MAEAVTDPPDAPKKSGRMMLILSIVLLLAAGVGGFFVVRAGLLPFGGGAAPSAPKVTHADSVYEDIAFIPLEPLLVTLPAGGESRHLRFRAQLEVPTAHKKHVENVLPRVVDVLNGYLRALEPRDLEAPAALVRLRAHMLRRVHVVVGEAWVRDILIMEFVLN